MSTPPAPPNPPVVANVSVGPDQLTVAWAPPTTGGVPTSYNVSINDSSSPVVIPDNGSSLYTHTFTGLTSDTLYTVSVVAINCAGTSNVTSANGTCSEGRCTEKWAGPAWPLPSPLPLANKVMGYGGHIWGMEAIYGVWRHGGHKWGMEAIYGVWRPYMGYGGHIWGMEAIYGVWRHGGHKWGMEAIYGVWRPYMGMEAIYGVCAIWYHMWYMYCSYMALVCSWYSM